MLKKMNALSCHSVAVVVVDIIITAITATIQHMYTSSLVIKPLFVQLLSFCVYNDVLFIWSSILIFSCKFRVSLNIEESDLMIPEMFQRVLNMPELTAATSGSKLKQTWNWNLPSRHECVQASDLPLFASLLNSYWADCLDESRFSKQLGEIRKHAIKHPECSLWMSNSLNSPVLIRLSKMQSQTVPFTQATLRNHLVQCSGRWWSYKGL